MVNTCQKLKVLSKHRLPAAANANNATNLGVTLAGKFYRAPSDSQGSRFLGLKRQESLGSYTHTEKSSYHFLYFPLCKIHMGFHCTTQESKIEHRPIIPPLPAAFPCDEASFSIMFPSQTCCETGLLQCCRPAWLAFFLEERGIEKA